MESPLSWLSPWQDESQGRLVLSEGDGRLRYPCAFSVEHITPSEVVLLPPAFLEPFLSGGVWSNWEKSPCLKHLWDLLRLGKLMELFSSLQKSVEFSCMLVHVEFVFYCIFAKELLGNMSTIDTVSVYIYFLVSFVIQRNFWNNFSLKCKDPNGSVPTKD